jgi:hypothetical protein
MAADYRPSQRILREAMFTTYVANDSRDEFRFLVLGVYPANNVVYWPD